MSRIFVDEENKTSAIASFTYINMTNNVEGVEATDTDNVVAIKVCDKSVDIYKQDISKLIKALKAAYKHIEGKEIDE